MTKPDFLCVGAAKCATTSLHKYLATHPDVFVPERKECHYYSCPEFTAHTNGPGDEICYSFATPEREDYEALFRNASDGQLLGEVSPSYFQYPAVPRRICNHAGNIKIIVMLRDPVYRAYSNYWHMVRSQGERLSFEQALEAEHVRLEQGYHEMWGLVTQGSYSTMLKCYIDTFGKESVHVILYEDLLKNEQDVWNELCDFLCVPRFCLEQKGVRHNNTEHSRYPASRRLLRIMKPFKSVATGILGERAAGAFKNRALKAAQCISQKEQMKMETYERLRMEFAEDTLAVERLIGRETGWASNSSQRGQNA